MKILVKAEELDKIKAAEELFLCAAVFIN